MATKIGQELVEFSFNQAETKLSNGTLGYDPKNLDLFTKKVEAYERELKRVFGSLVTTVSQIDQVTGQAVSKFYLPKRYEAEALGVRRAVDLQEFGKQGMNSTQAKNLMYQGTTDAVFLETTSRIKGTKAQQFAKEAVLDVGGKIIKTPNKADKDMITTFIPISDAQLSAMGSKDINNFVSNVMPSANSASRAEQRARTKKEKEAERDAQLERDAKRQQAHLRDLKRQNEKQQRDQERQQKQRIKEAEQEEKDKIQSRKQTLGRIGRGGALLTLIANITRRILTSVLNFASETSKQQTKANTLNIGVQDVRGLNYMDTALGLDKGTQLQGQEDLRASFGNTANLDTEKLKWLAMVMGNGVVDVIQSGLGGSNPALLQEKIIDAFFERQQEGADQYGNQVGQDKARRALVTLLEAVSPSIARTLERMIEEQTSGIHAGEITNYRQFQNFYSPSTMGLTSIDWEQFTMLGKEADELKAKFQNLGEIIKVDVGNAFSDFIGKLNNLHLGQTEEEAFLDDLSDLDRLKNWYNGYAEIRSNAQEELTNFLGGYGLKKASIEDVIKWGGYTDEDVYGMTDTETAHIYNSRKALTAIYANPEMFNMLRTYYASGALMSEIEEQSYKTNPNADPNRYGDVGFSKKKGEVEAVYFSRLAYLKANELAFTDDLYKTLPHETAIKKSARIREGNLGIDDIVPEKQDYFVRGAWEFLKNAKSFGKNNKFSDALSDALKQYNSLRGTASAISKDSVFSMFEKWEQGELDDAGVTQLADIFTHAITGSDIKNKTRQLAMSTALYTPDKYGLTKGEWENIQESIDNMKVNKKYKSYNRSTDIQQGNTAGTIDIVMHVLDAKGHEVQQIKKTIQGTLDKDFNYEEHIKNINN